jgi:hypothetical protein
MKTLLARSIPALERLLHKISECQIQRFAPMVAVGRSHHALASGIGVHLTRDVMWARSAVEVASGLATANAAAIENAVVPTPIDHQHNATLAGPRPVNAVNSQTAPAASAGNADQAPTIDAHGAVFYLWGHRNSPARRALTKGALK